MTRGFDRFADAVERRVGSAPFFMLCCFIILAWGPSYFLFNSINSWQLVVNTFTTIVTFLLVALLQNTQARFEDATNARLQEILDKLDGANDPVNDPGETVQAA